jgi:NADH-quinone oxidoreductase chain I
MQTIIEIIKGLWLTLKHFWERAITVQYPKERVEVRPGFRGAHALMKDPKTGEELCVVCGLCAAICPAGVITIEAHIDNTGKRIADAYVVDLGRCLFCGLCEEACPKDAIRLTTMYELAEYDRDNVVYDKERLLSNGDIFQKELLAT